MRRVSKKEGGGGRAHLDESADDAEGGEAQVLKWTCFRSCVQERVQEEGYMGYFVFFSVESVADAWAGMRGWKRVPFRKSCLVSG